MDVNESLRDIRSLEAVPDISLYLFILMVGFAGLLLFGLIMMVLRHYKNKRKDLTRKEVRKRLENIDFNKPKEAAYQITKYARYLATQEQSQKIFAQLEPLLERYKYVKNPPSFDEETIAHYHLFLEVVDD